VSGNRWPATPTSTPSRSAGSREGSDQALLARARRQIAHAEYLHAFRRGHSVALLLAAPISCSCPLGTTRVPGMSLPHGTCPLKREGRPPGPAGYVKPEVSLRAFGQQPRLEGSRSYRDVRVTERGAKATALRRVCLRRRNGRLRCIAGRGRPAQQHARLECGRAVVGDEPRAEFRVNVAGTACDKRIADRSS